MTTGLPIEDVVGEVRTALRDPGLGVLVASPGAGKTTVVPLRLLSEPWLGDDRVLVLEPRRVATRAAARRMADLLGERVGATVGYTTRDDRRRGPQTRIEVVTDGILTRRLQHDPELTGVAAVVFDEFHERRLESDLGLALTLDVRRSLRPDLRVLVMSATLDAERVADLLGDREPAPVIRSVGRLHPVDVQWRPTDLPVGRRWGRAVGAPAAAAVSAAFERSDGDVLVFLPGMGEIRAVEAALRERRLDADVRLLHGSLPATEQDAALAPGRSGRRKVVLSTDVAQTSLTVEGITAVVDAGLQREPEFSPRTGMTRLTTVAASQDAAVQRAGRAGRLGPGLAIRLWSEAEHARRRAHTRPEIEQVDLARALLEVTLWGAAFDELPLLDPPPAPALESAGEVLVSLGALDRDGRLTRAGRAMTGLPLHPRVSAVLLAAAAERVDRAAALAALLEEGDVLRGRPGEVGSDIGTRLALVAERSRHHPQASGAALDRVRRRSTELRDRLARRGSDDLPVGVATSDAAMLAAGYPDRIGRRREGQRGRFVLRNGRGASVDDADPLAAASFCVVADLDDRDGDARIRLAAALDADDIEAIVGDAIEVDDELVWDDDRDDLYLVRERRLGAIVLSRDHRRPEPGPATISALTAAVQDRGLELLQPSEGARRLQRRLEFLHSQLGADWPDVADAALLDDLDEWFAVAAAGASGRRDLARIDLAGVLRARLAPHHHRLLDELAPETHELPSGRRVPVRYAPDHPPTVIARVQEVFGLTTHPTVARTVPLVFDLRSPADRTVQLTSDLPGFWAGSWHEVRKEMGGRYPKHDWPEHPTQVPSRNRVRARRTGT